MTAVYAGWAGIQNGELLKRAEEAGFAVLVTGDQNLAYQQNLTGRGIAIVGVSAQDWPSLRRHLAAIAAAMITQPAARIR